MSAHKGQHPKRAARRPLNEAPRLGTSLVRSTALSCAMLRTMRTRHTKITSRMSRTIDALLPVVLRRNRPTRLSTPEETAGRVIARTKQYADERRAWRGGNDRSRAFGCVLTTTQMLGASTAGVRKHDRRGDGQRTL
eukprot:3658710-Prymnesium_polylepis.1